MRAMIMWTALAVAAVMGLLSWLHIPFARRFWVRIERLGYIYVALIIVLAVLSLVLGRRL
jgi:hypothetical protein